MLTGEQYRLKVSDITGKTSASHVMESEKNNVFRIVIQTSLIDSLINDF